MLDQNWKDSVKSNESYVHNLHESYVHNVQNNSEVWVWMADIFGDTNTLSGISNLEFRTIDYRGWLNFEY